MRPGMTLDGWIRSRRPRLTDTAFAAALAAPGRSAPSRQAVGKWRRRECAPSPEHARWIAAVTDGAVGEVDLRRAAKRGK